MTPPASRILRKLPREKAFYFFTSIGNYTGEKAASLEEFAEKIEKVDGQVLANPTQTYETTCGFISRYLRCHCIDSI